MYHTVLNHETGWIYAMKTLLICRTNSKHLILTNTQGSHAEMKWMSYLHRMDKSVMTTITIYILAILPVQVRHTSVQGG